MSNLIVFLSRLPLALATGLGVGFIRWAPGTVGTLWGIPLACWLSQYSTVGQIVTIVLLCAVGVPLCGHAAFQVGRKDPSCVVWDEFVTLPIVFLGMGSAAFERPSVVIAGFALHRVFDISKLSPGRQLEQWPEGWGIMLDDVVAALYAWAVLWTIRWLGWL